MTRDEETQQLWLDYRQTGDQKIRDRLILMYAPLVKYVARRLITWAGSPDEGDLFSYGLRGLVGAIDDYDPARGGKFDTYAKERIKRPIIDELLSMGWDDSAEGSGGAGVREPRRPLPHAPSAEDVVDPAA